MQQHAPEAVDLAKETEKTREVYGLDDKETADFGTRLLLARRLVERGVRFVQVYSGGGPLVDAVGRPRRPQRQPREDVRPRRSSRSPRC